VSHFDEFLAELLIILNDAIVDYSHFATAIGMRVSIELGDSTMGCPAGMPDGYIAGKTCQVLFLDDFVNFADILPYQQPAIAQRSYAC
jgi:hypothetical protein